MTGLWHILLALAFVFGNGFFVGAEFALISARRTQIEPLAQEGSHRAKATIAAMENIGLMIAGAQLGVTICSLALGALGEPAVAELLHGPLETAGVPEGAVHLISFLIAMSAVVFLHVVLGEMVPKNIALAGPERSAMILGPMLAGLVRVFRPAIVALNMTASVLLRLLRVEQRSEVASAFTREEVAGFMEESHREGLLDEEEHELLSGALSFEGDFVTSVLLPFDRLVVVSEESTGADVEERCVQTGYSRFPVVSQSGTVLGYLHLKDVLESDPDKRLRTIASKWIRPMASVSPTDTLRSVLRTMQARGSHMARVVETDGSVIGVVALEDVLEQLVGEVRDATQASSVRLAD